MRVRRKRRGRSNIKMFLHFLHASGRTKTRLYRHHEVWHADKSGLLRRWIMLETDHPIPRGPRAELRATVEVPGAALVGLAQWLLSAGRKGRGPWAGFLLGANRAKPYRSQAQRRGWNSWDLRNGDCRSWFGLAAGSVPAASSFSSLNSRDDVCGGPLGSKTFCLHLSVASLIIALMKLQMLVISMEKFCNFT